MKRKRFSVEQTVVVLKQAEVGVRVAELIRKLGISEQFFLTVGKAAQGLRGRLGAPGETVAGGERRARTDGDGFSAGWADPTGGRLKKTVRPRAR